MLLSSLIDAGADFHHLVMELETLQLTDMT
jgi:hypothetical protein